MYFKKISVLIITFLLIECGNTNAQTALPDTTFSTSFSFLDDSGNPLGVILNSTASGFVIFQYNDGRKFVGWMTANQPRIDNYARVYYPDGTIYMGHIGSGKNPILTEQENLISIRNVCGGIYYPDGTHFIGNVLQYRLRTGFQFAPDGTYMLGAFFYKNPYGYLTYKTIHYATNHQLTSEGYHIIQDEEMDFENFKKKYKKEKPGISPENAKKLNFKDKHYRDKECEYIRFETKKNDESFGFFENKNICKIGRSTTISGSYFSGGGEYKVEYINSGDTTYIAIPGTGILMSPTEAPYNGLYTTRLKRGDGMQFRATDWAYKYDEKGSGVVNYVASNGSYYLGVEYSNLLNGYAINKIVGYGTYYGNYVEGKRSGAGTIRYNNGGYSKGFWQNDLMNGNGRTYNAVGQLIAEGIYENGKLITPKKVDLGWYEFIDEFPVAKPEKPFYVTTEVTNKKFDGVTYTGSIANGKPEGYGVLSFNDGNTRTGNWHLGNPTGVMTVQAAAVQENGKTLAGNTYVGEMKNNKLEGMGRLITKDGQEWIGTFSNGKLNGSCQLWNADGTGEMGNIVNGLREGRIESVKRNLSFYFGYRTYVHDVAEGDANIYLGNNEYSRGNIHNNKNDGVWTHTEVKNGSSTILGTVTYRDGVEISRSINK